MSSLQWGILSQEAYLEILEWRLSWDIWTNIGWIGIAEVLNSNPAATTLLRGHYWWLGKLTQHFCMLGGQLRSCSGLENVRGFEAMLLVKTSIYIVPTILSLSSRRNHQFRYPVYYMLELEIVVLWNKALLSIDGMLTRGWEEMHQRIPANSQLSFIQAQPIDDS